MRSRCGGGDGGFLFIDGLPISEHTLGSRSNISEKHSGESRRPYLFHKYIGLYISNDILPPDVSKTAESCF